MNKQAGTILTCPCSAKHTSPDRQIGDMFRITEDSSIYPAGDTPLLSFYVFTKSFRCSTTGTGLAERNLSLVTVQLCYTYVLIYYLKYFLCIYNITGR